MWVDGFAAGGLLFIGFATQTLGLVSTTASDSALITGLFVVPTPLIAAAVRRALPPFAPLAGATLSGVGPGLLTVTAGFALDAGDVLAVACAVAFPAHIVALARLARWHPGVPLTAAQILVVTVLGLVASAISEGFPLPTTLAIPAFAGTGEIVSAGAFMMHVAAQRVIGPSRTAIMLSTEPVVAAATAAVVLGERLTPRGWFGAALIMSRVYVGLAFSPPEEADLVAKEGTSEAH